MNGNARRTAACSREGGCSAGVATRQAHPTLLRLPSAPQPLQAFGPGLVQQLSEPLLFVDFLREPRRDEATGEVVEARPRWAGRRGCRPRCVSPLGGLSMLLRLRVGTCA